MVTKDGEIDFVAFLIPVDQKRKQGIHDAGQPVMLN